MSLAKVERLLERIKANAPGESRGLLWNWHDKEIRYFLAGKPTELVAKVGPTCDLVPALTTLAAQVDPPEKDWEVGHVLMKKSGTTLSGRGSSNPKGSVVVIVEINPKRGKIVINTPEGYTVSKAYWRNLTLEAEAR